MSGLDALRAGLVDPDNVPAIPDKSYVQVGDPYVLGDHRLLCGDAANAADVARLLEGAFAQANDEMVTPLARLGHAGEDAGRCRLLAFDQDLGVVSCVWALRAFARRFSGLLAARCRRPFSGWVGLWAMTYDELVALEHESWIAYVTGVVSCTSRAKVTRAGGVVTVLTGLPMDRFNQLVTHGLGRHGG